MVCQEKKINKKTIKGYGSAATLSHKWKTFIKKKSVQQNKVNKEKIVWLCILFKMIEEVYILTLKNWLQTIITEILILQMFITNDLFWTVVDLIDVIVTVMVWYEFSLQYCITVNKNLILFYSDGMIRVFTTDGSRVATTEELSAFDNAVATAEVPTQVGDIKMSDLPGPEALLNPGSNLPL